MAKDMIRKIPPCSSCDIEGLESWLTDMAREGLHLRTDGIGSRSWHFMPGEGKEVPYRLVPGRGAPTVGAFFGRHTDRLPEDPPQVILDRYRDQGWEYVTRQGHCYIFRAADPYEGAFRVEPRIWPEDVSRMIQWEWRDLPFWLLMIFVAAPAFLYAISGWGTPLLALNEFLWVYVLLLAAGFVLVAERAIHLFHLIWLRRKLDSGERFDHKKDWRPAALRTRTVKVLQIVFLVVWTVGSPFLPIFQNDNYELLEDYPGDPPFPVLSELAQGWELESQDRQDGMYRGTRTLLIPVYIEWWENCEIEHIRGIYYRVDYYETLTPAMAHELAEELWYQEEKEFHYRAEDLPNLRLDYAVVYDQEEKVILQEGTKVIQATLDQELHQYIPLEVWTAQLAESMTNK